MLTLEGVKLVDLSISQDDKGAVKVQGNYNLVSSSGRVLAKQGFNGYNEVKLPESIEVQKAVKELWKTLKNELDIHLGMLDE